MRAIVYRHRVQAKLCHHNFSLLQLRYQIHHWSKNSMLRVIMLNYRKSKNNKKWFNLLYKHLKKLKIIRRIAGHLDLTLKVFLTKVKKSLKLLSLVRLVSQYRRRSHQMLLLFQLIRRICHIIVKAWLFKQKTKVIEVVLYHSRTSAPIHSTQTYLKWHQFMNNPR